MIAHSVLFAHQGGWDEFLLVLGPIVVIAAALALAKRRVDRAAAATNQRTSDIAGPDE